MRAVTDEDDLELKIIFRIIEILDRKSRRLGPGSDFSNPSLSRSANIVNNFLASTHHISFNQSEEGISMNDDTYTVGQAGAVGRNATAENFSFSQTWNQVAPNMDLPTLVAELAQLRTAMAETAGNVPDRYLAIASVAEAEQSAANDDGPRMMEHLKKAGSWALDVAKSIGTGVAEAAIKASLGI